MKLVPLVLGLLTFASGAVLLRSDDARVVILTGNTMGYLAPCGCSEPMIGGVKRRAAAIALLTKGRSATILDNNGWVTGIGRQDQIKAETLAQLAAQSKVTAINLGVAEARLGKGMLMQLARLSGGRLTSASISDAGGEVQPLVMDGPFLIGGISSRPSDLATPLAMRPIPTERAAQTLVQEAEASGLAPVVMLDGDKADAVRLAQAFPKLALVHYRSIGTPGDKPEMVGETLIASPGEQGKHLLRLEWQAGRFTAYEVVTLTPAYADDPHAAEIYATYLKRVSDERLLEKLPRGDTAGFAGSWSCMPCHQNATKVWKNSEHRWALETLQKVGHSRDPDCVSCHVVGLSSSKGFKTEKETPHLKGVGCESCHGNALSHARAPQKYRMAKIDSKSCVSCHNPQNSPKFDFASYWQKIRH